VPRLYLAGPEVFLPDADEIAAAKVAVCAAHGIEGQDPNAAVAPLLARPDLIAGALGLEMFAALVAQIDRCDGVIANLTPFRGPSADVGTVWEVGYAIGRGLPVFAYTNTTAHYAERVVEDGLHIEAFDFADNLMLEGAIASHGALIRVDGGDDPVQRLRHLEGFERCARAAAHHFGVGAA
jgi:nucleoside 2-deoxyribosyltransferase